MTGEATPFQNTAGKCAADEQLGPAAVEGGRRGELPSTWSGIGFGVRLGLRRRPRLRRRLRLRLRLRRRRRRRLRLGLGLGLGLRLRTVGARLAPPGGGG